MFAPPPRPSEVRPGISPAFDAVIATGMAKNPADRYGSAGELARAAAAAAHGRGPRPQRGAPAAARRQFSRRAPYPPVARATGAGRARARFSGTQKALLLGRSRCSCWRRGWPRRSCSPGGKAAPPSPRARWPPAVGVDYGDRPPRPRRRPTAPPADAGCRARTAGLRRAGGALRRRQHAGVGDPHRRSLAVICQTSPGSYYYHGERLADGANVKIAERRADRRRVRRREPGRRRPLPGAPRRADDHQQRARRLGGDRAGVRLGLAGQQRVALHRQVADPDAGGVVDRVGHRGGRADDADLADAPASPSG